MKPLAFLLAAAAFAFTPNPTLVNLADNTALDLGAYTCTGPVGESSSYCRGITDYSGMTYNPVHHTICLWGGGHSTTFRDDIDIFNFTTLTWDSSYVPTPCAEMITSNLNTDQASWISTGHPVSRHSYDLLAVAGNGEFLMLRAGGGRGSCYAGPDWLPSGRVGHYNFTSKQWTYGAAMGSLWSNLASCEYDPISGLVIILSEQSTTGLWTYDPVAKTAVRRLAVSNLPGYANNMVYFPPNDKFYFIDDGSSIYEVTLNRSNWAASTVTQVTGITGDVPSLPETGFAYDSANGVIGGGVVSGVFHAFNPLAKTWTARTIQTSSSTAVGSQQFHALDYDPVNNVYIIIANGHTWAYRYAGGSSRVESKARVLPAVNRLYASPNPFGSAVTLSVQGGAPDLALRVYDLGGGLVADLSQGIEKGTVTWKPSCRPGVYVARLESGNAFHSRKLVFLK